MRGITADPTPTVRAMTRLRQAARDAGLRVHSQGHSVGLGRFGHQVSVDIGGTGPDRYWLVALPAGVQRYTWDENATRRLVADVAAVVTAAADSARTIRPATSHTAAPVRRDRTGGCR